MKKFLVSITIPGALLCALLCALMLGLCAVARAQSQTNFSGTWALDLKKTRDVPAELKSYTLTVTQENQQLSFESKVEGDPNPPKPDQAAGHDAQPAGPPAHPTASTVGIPSGNTPTNENGPGTSNSRTVLARGRALALIIRRLTCSLDGKEVTREVGGALPGQIRRKAFWRKGDKSLEINVAREFDVQGNKFTSTVKEQWDLSDAGKTLRIKRTVNLLAGWDETTLVFNKQ
jgi:hypothetical protein